MMLVRSSRSLLAFMFALTITAACSSGTSEGNPEITAPPSVQGPVAKVSVSISYSPVVAGKTATAVAVVTDSAGHTLSGRAIVWSISDTTLATLTPAGILTGHHPGVATVTAMVEGVSGSAVITVQAGVAATISVIRGSGLIARPGRPVLTLPVIRAFDSDGNPALGNVQFTVSAGGGTVPYGTVPLVEAGSGKASVGGWTMGSSPGINTLTVTSGSASTTISVTAAEQPTTPFDIALHFDAALSPAAKEVFQDAVVRWRQGITAALPAYHIVAPAGACYPNSPAIDTTTTGLVVLVRVAPTPGAAAMTTPCQFRPTGLPALSVTTFTTGGIDTTSTPTEYGYVITHEFGHALGLGSATQWFKLRTGTYGSYTYTGINAIAEFVKLAGPAYQVGIPLAADGAHWSYALLPGDVLSGGGTDAWTLSAVTLAALKDIGYAVDMSKSDGRSPVSP